MARARSSSTAKPSNATKAKVSATKKSKASKTKVSTTKKSNISKKKKNVQTTGLKTPADVSKAMFQFMCSEHAFGMTEWTREELANAVGFKNPKYDKCSHGLRMLVKEEGLAQNGKGKGTFMLSVEGLAKMPRESQPKTLEEVHERFLVQLEAKVACAPSKVRPLWDILMDRKAHNIDTIAHQLGYTNPRSFLNSKVLSLMEGMGLLTKKSKVVTMTNKAFPSNLTHETIVDL